MAEYLLICVIVCNCQVFFTITVLLVICSRASTFLRAAKSGVSGGLFTVAARIGDSWSGGRAPGLFLSGIYDSTGENGRGGKWIEGYIQPP